MNYLLNLTDMNRIARNTIFLYCRMLFLLFVGLYTSRVVLDSLGVSDLGIYNATGGLVALFSVLSGSLAAAISRFLTYELGKGSSNDDLNKVFASSLTIQCIIAGVIIILAEALGPWFLSSKMTIPAERMSAAHWVLQFSIITFAINLISVPYNAAIIAHEKMGAFAYIGMFEGLAKLGVAFLISISPIDRLIWYALLMCAVALAVRFAYSFYCRHQFAECRGRLIFDGKLFGQMFSFAGWNFIGASSAVLRDHGGNILINVFCGPAVNGARAVAMQLSAAVQGFVTNFMTALNPQITKSYASGDRQYMNRLICTGARYSFFLLLIIGLPVLMETDFLMEIWLKDVPDHAVRFVRLAIIFSMSESLSLPVITAVLATGDIKKYQIIVGGLQLLNIPASWIALHFGCEPECVLVIAIIISQLCLLARLTLTDKMIGLKAKTYLTEVYLPSIATAVLSVALPIAISLEDASGWGGFIMGCCICIIWTGLCVLFAGMKCNERKALINKILKKNDQYSG